ncbi:MAG: His/Gly/Thr/Pro-type tRNA ligase C-terminal domain-containing protein [Patescibacteria group bacterium]|nr:His/Gly/Thr/Pro-type tRNA ligase C-terminal domain-containing protein [Patescibacteria group bacterium]
MKYSELFGKATKSELKEDLSANAKYLIKGGFVDQLMSGSYTLLPLGFRVVKKIEQIIREEMNKTGAQELLMPLLHPKDVWNETGRWDSAKEVMYQFKKDDKEFALSFTHEEIVLDLIRKHAFAYKDFPIKIYHFSTKFRNELRAKSGLLRGREFLMKDLYSLHISEKDLDKYYWEIADSYIKIFKKLGLDAKITEAAGGVFTDEHTHEFQVLCDSGEDIVFYCEKCDFCQNKEIATVQDNDNCPKCPSTSSGQVGKIKSGNSIEVGNIFKFGTFYSKKMNVYFMDEKGEKQLPYFASYGIGLTRLMGILAEMFHDGKGIIWPKVVAPFRVHLISIGKNADELYEKLKKDEVEVLYDDRDVSPGEKFADADLIGIPVRLVVSEKTLRQSSGQAGEQIEYKERISEEKILLNYEQILNKIKKN